MSDEIEKVNDRLDRLEEKLNNFIELFKKPEEQKSEDKITISDIESFYKNEDFETFYKICREFETDEDRYSSDVTNEKSLFSRLFLCLSYIDIDKIARQIVSINKDKANEGYYLYSTDVEDITSFEAWRKCLLNCVKSVVDYLIQYGEADKNCPLKNYQMGRVHLTSMFVTYEDESINRLELYWTDDHCESSDETW